MKIINKLLLASTISMSAAFAVTASAAEVIPAENRICTRDYNAWGHASRCSCPTESTYDQRSAFCLAGDLEKVESTGAVSTGMAAVGGETTGVVFQANANDYELILPLKLKAELEATDLSQTQFLIEGDYLEVPGIETGARPTIIVNSLTPIQNFSR